MTVVSKQVLLDYFANSGRATNNQSEFEYDMEDLIDTLFDQGTSAVGTDIFIPAGSGYDYTGGSQIYLGQTVFSISAGIGLDAGNDLEGTGFGIMRNAGTITLTPLVRIDPVTTGNVRMQAACHNVPSGTSGLSGQDDSDSVAATTISLPSYSGTNPHWEISELAQTLTVAAGDVVVVFTRRVGSHAADTYDGYLDLRGWRIS